LERLFNLPDTPLANQFVSEAIEQLVYPLTLVMCAGTGGCGHVQLLQIVSQETLYSNYVYKTGTSPVTQARLASLASHLIRLAGIDKNGQVVEIGCNDGTFLKAFEAKGIKKLIGIDPSGDVGDSKIELLRKPFSSGVAEDVVAKYGKSQLVIADNVMAHVEDVRDMLEGAKVLLSDGGYLTMEVAYVRDLLNHNAFDTIYHEHASYHAVTPLYNMFADINMNIVHAEWDVTQVGRGSLRLLVRNLPRTRGMFPHESVQQFLSSEGKEKTLLPETYRKFYEETMKICARVTSTISYYKTRGYQIAAYGAPAKMTTFMYVAQMAAGDVEYVADDAPDKHDMFTPGLHVPVRQAIDASPKEEKIAIILFGWNFASSILAKHRKTDWTWIVPLPNLVHGTAEKLLGEMDKEEL
jgi:SAM-dependent methyltransferase